jgi:Fanconi-associated nuclease 1
MNYKDKDNAALEDALQITRDGLQDPATHLSTGRISSETPNTNRLILVYRPGLEKRLARLEKKLDVPAEDRYKSLTRLKKSSTILIKGRRAVPKSLQTATSLLVSLTNSTGLSDP